MFANIRFLLERILGPLTSITDCIAGRVINLFFLTYNKLSQGQFFWIIWEEQLNIKRGTSANVIYHTRPNLHPGTILVQGILTNTALVLYIPLSTALVLYIPLYTT